MAGHARPSSRSWPSSLLGAYFRFSGINWDSNTHLHPDERFITMVENSISLPGSVAEYFDTDHSPLNPYNRGYNSFVYGTFPLFLVRWMGELLGKTGYDEIHLVGRAASALFDLGSVFLVFLIGRRLFGTREGLLASLLTAGAVIQIQQSHFFTFDTFVGFFLLASFLFALRLWERERWYDYPLPGRCSGPGRRQQDQRRHFLLAVGLVADEAAHDVAANESRDRIAGWTRVIGWFAASGMASPWWCSESPSPMRSTGPGFLNFGLSSKFLGDMGYRAETG